jgi:hypothetical protein
MSRTLPGEVSRQASANAPPRTMSLPGPASLWIYGTAGTGDEQSQVMAGTQTAFQANTTELWTAGGARVQDLKLGMMPGTSPSIAEVPSGSYEIAFQANSTNLWTVGAVDVADHQLGMNSAMCSTRSPLASIVSR